MTAKWSQAWLKYSEKKDKSNGKYFNEITVVGFDAGNKIIKNAVKELILGAKGYYNAEPNVVSGTDTAKGIVICKESISDEYIAAKKEEGITLGQLNEGYSITCDADRIVIKAAGEVGALYGAFRLLTVCATGALKRGYEEQVIPDNPLRMLNHWDNMDNSIERGYSGESFFFVNNQVVVDERTVDYARLTASVGLNAVVINNIND